ncbi:hypothetical protein SLH46_09770 [Draconibacterium sp. IB214405]|uniref:hypothetical protein n=1 Tax=Draconibacterium sp. IB214405 TaxID=3097352 RepID=UPI002A16CB8F|nr:hypothetical protein [Draconibacterium sp. IB214405]MDX8339469.1 hypothetical protein [Draconibacterium sp. IB214405]
MKNTIQVNGIIYKYEKLVQIPLNTPYNVYIAEASTPYADYYGQVPRMAKPNSIFLFTKNFYFLEELICYSSTIEKCLLEHINIASAVVESGGKQYPAIRIKDFPDYSQLVKLQDCLTKNNVEFTDKLSFDGEVKTKVSKPFILEELEPDFYMDQVEEHKGYIVINRHFNAEEFESAIKQIRYNGVCKLFDAEQGELYYDGKLVHIVRIFSEALDLAMLKCLQKEFSKL